MIAMAGNNAYVARISLGANQMQAIKAIREAEAFDGPSIIIAYAPCIAHGFDLINGEEHSKMAVNSGYWGLYRFNPDLIGSDNSPLQIDSTPDADNAQSIMKQYLQSENRYKEIHKTDIDELVDARLKSVKYANDLREHVAKFKKN